MGAQRVEVTHQTHCVIMRHLPRRNVCHYGPFVSRFAWCVVCNTLMQRVLRYLHRMACLLHNLRCCAGWLG